MTGRGDHDHSKSSSLSLSVFFIDVSCNLWVHESETSDLDYLVITAGGTTPESLISIVDGLRSSMVENIELTGPGNSGLFGECVPIGELVTRIGLQGDTNQSLSRRILLLEESVSLARPESHRNALQQILSRYLQANPESAQIPRFLLNDIIRYWRTVAIDFQAKADGESPKALRYLKLLIPRKLCFVSSLSPLWLLHRSSLQHHEEKLLFLTQQFEQPASLRLIRFLAEICTIDASMKPHAQQALLTLDYFVECSGSPKWRKAVESEAFGENPKSSAHYGEMRGRGKQLHQHLQAITTGSAMRDFTHEFLLI